MKLYTLKNEHGFSAQFSDLGARWISMYTPDKHGFFDDIILGFDQLDSYLSAEEQYHGAVVGRVCGRIKNAEFTLAGKHYLLATNDGLGTPKPNHLHGGIHAFHTKQWKALETTNSSGEQSIVFFYCSKDGEEGYPGNLYVTTTYTLTHHNELVMECKATCDQCTPVNITNHAFFNLQGKQVERPNILNHYLTLNAAYYVECDDELIPTGNVLPVAQTPLDFTQKKRIADSLKYPHHQISQNSGYSIPYILNKEEGVTKVTLAARLEDPISERVMEIYTNQISLQVYNGYYMNGADVGKNNQPYFSSAGIALETQGYPDAVNQSSFPSIILSPQETYTHLTRYCMK